MINYEEYEKLPTQDRWMAHATMPATLLLRLWKRKFERLIWMALYNPRGGAGTAQFFSTVMTRQDEDDMLASDDDYEPEEEENENAEEEGNESDSEDDIMNEDGQIPAEEVDKLMEDAYGEEAHQRKIELQSQESSADEKSTEFSESEPTDQRQFRLINLERKAKVSPLLASSDKVLYLIERDEV